MAIPDACTITGDSSTLSKPTLPVEIVIELLQHYYSISVTSAGLRSLPSYDDQNFMVTSDNNKYVLKIFNIEVCPDVLGLQYAFMKFLSGYGYPVSTVIHSKDDQVMVDLNGHKVWLLTYVPGVPYAKLKPHSPEFIGTVGQFVGRLDKDLMNFESPDSARRSMAWDLRFTPALRKLISIEKVENRKCIATEVINEYERIIDLHGKELRWSVIHNDPNDYNILVNLQTSQIEGLIDFGDVVYSHTVNNAAIAAAYATTYAKRDNRDPLAIAEDFFGAYVSSNPLNDSEIDSFFALLCARLTMTALNAAVKMVQYPDDEYVFETMEPAYTVLENIWPRKLEAEQRFKRFKNEQK